MSEAVSLFAHGLPSESSGSALVIVLGTAQGNLHDIGRDIVKITMQARGFDVVYIEGDVTTERFLKAAEESRAQLVGISALLSTTMRTIEETIRRFTDAWRPGSLLEVLRSARASLGASVLTATRGMPTLPRDWS